MDAGAQLGLIGGGSIEILPGAQQPGEEKRRLDEIAAVVLSAERHRPAGPAIEKMRKDAVVAVRPAQEAHHAQQVIDRLLPPDPAPLRTDHDRHDAEPGAAGGDGLQAILRRLVGALPGEPAHGMGEVPEISEGLSLHELEQGVIVEIDPA
jgi:hypothetical protein